MIPLKAGYYRVRTKYVLRDEQFELPSGAILIRVVAGPQRSYTIEYLQHHQAPQ